MPVAIKELLKFLDDHFLTDHKYSNVTATPQSEIAPKPWLLGTSKKSALLAAENGMAYAFGHFMSDHDGREIIKEYKETFKLRNSEDKPQGILAVSVICAETKERAEELALSSYVWKKQTERGEVHAEVSTMQQTKNYLAKLEEKEILRKMKTKTIIGSQSEVCHKLKVLQKQDQADEMMLITNT